MPPGGRRGSIAVVFVAWVEVEFEDLLPLVDAAEPDVDVVDCTAEGWLAWESDDTACQRGHPSFGFGTYYCSGRFVALKSSPICLDLTPAMAKLPRWLRKEEEEEARVEKRA
jgi:hypothetical protein